MKLLHKLLFACIPLAMLAACGGGDTEDRLDVADPVVRFVHAAPSTSAVTLYRATVAQSDATNATFGFASNYFDVDMGVADWPVKAVASGDTIGSVNIDPERGTKYTIVTLDTSATTHGVYLITDPYNKPLTSDSTRLRLMNAAYPAGSVDVYMNTPTTDIATVNPLIAGTAVNSSGPAPGQDSVDIPGGTYQLTIAAAGTKTVLFRAQLSFANNQDLLLLAVPNTAVPGAIRVLLKTEGTAGTTELTAI
jgi:hypothetical protein